MKWAEIGFRLIPYIVSAVNAVERLRGAASGKEKQDAAVDLATELVHSIEGIAAKDILDDAKVQDAVRKAIDAVVNVQNVIAALKASRPTPGA